MMVIYFLVDLVIFFMDFEFVDNLFNGVIEIYCRVNNFFMVYFMMFKCIDLVVYRGENLVRDLL